MIWRLEFILSRHVTFDEKIFPYASLVTGCETTASLDTPTFQHNHSPSIDSREMLILSLILKKIGA